MMSPFSSLLRSIRISRGKCQSELADLIGYEQTYISALETGKKGPPNQEFVKRLINALYLSGEEVIYLNQSFEASNRKLIIDCNVQQEIYWLINDLRKNIDHLSPVQISLIRDILSLKDTIHLQPAYSVHNLKKRKNGEVDM
jgi:transcriptional regulator with XRE-family HTH domain